LSTRNKAARMWSWPLTSI